jgi:hypothetical protein
VQINPLTLTTQPNPAATAAAVQTLRVTAGDVSQIQTGVVVAASVQAVRNGQAVLDLDGRAVTVRGAIALTPGDVLNVRVAGGSSQMLELVAPQPKPQTGTSPPPTPAAPTPPRVAVADVIARLPDGQFQVSIDGGEAVARSQQPLTPGGRYVVQVETTPTGTVLKPLPEAPDSPELAKAVATAILRTDRPPPIASNLPPLLRELEAVPPQPVAQTAAAEVKAAVRAITGEPGQPPTADTLRAAVSDGGQQFEAKLARAVAPDEPTDPGRTPPASQPNAAPDLKGGLLKLLAAVPEFAAALPASASVIDSIERQQAANVLAQQTGGPFVFQIPFPDGAHWRTLHLGVEPDRDGPTDDTGRPTGFRVMMHVPLTHLGETWVDAGSDGNTLRAVLYLSDAVARERLTSDLPDLQAELTSNGFATVLLDVRPASDLTDKQRRRANALQAELPEAGGVLDVRV